MKTPAPYFDDYDRVVIFQPKKGENRDSLYEKVCRAYEDRPLIEQDEKGNVYLMPLGGGESGYQDGEAYAQLRNWARRKKHGEAFGPATTFAFANGAKRCPDAAWASNERVYAIPYEMRRGNSYRA